MKQTKFADANVNVLSTKITSLALTKSLIGYFSLVLCLDLKDTNVSLRTFEDVKYIKHFCIFLSFSKSERSYIFFLMS